MTAESQDDDGLTAAIAASLKQEQPSFYNNHQEDRDWDQSGRNQEDAIDLLDDDSDDDDKDDRDDGEGDEERIEDDEATKILPPHLIKSQSPPSSPPKKKAKTSNFALGESETRFAQQRLQFGNAKKTGLTQTRLNFSKRPRGDPPSSSTSSSSRTLGNSKMAETAAAAISATDRSEHSEEDDSDHAIPQAREVQIDTCGSQNHAGGAAGNDSEATTADEELSDDNSSVHHKTANHEDPVTTAIQDEPLGGDNAENAIELDSDDSDRDGESEPKLLHPGELRSSEDESKSEPIISLDHTDSENEISRESKISDDSIESIRSSSDDQSDLQSLEPKDGSSSEGETDAKKAEDLIELDQTSSDSDSESDHESEPKYLEPPELTSSESDSDSDFEIDDNDDDTTNRADPPAHKSVKIQQKNRSEAHIVSASSSTDLTWQKQQHHPVGKKEAEEHTQSEGLKDLKCRSDNESEQAASPYAQSSCKKPEESCYAKNTATRNVPETTFPAKLPLAQLPPPAKKMKAPRRGRLKRQAMKSTKKLEKKIAPMKPVKIETPPSILSAVLAVESPKEEEQPKAAEANPKSVAAAAGLASASAPQSSKIPQASPSSVRKGIPATQAASISTRKQAPAPVFTTTTTGFMLNTKQNPMVVKPPIPTILGPNGTPLTDSSPQQQQQQQQHYNSYHQTPYNSLGLGQTYPGSMYAQYVAASAYQQQYGALSATFPSGSPVGSYLQNYSNLSRQFPLSNQSFQVQQQYQQPQPPQQQRQSQQPQHQQQIRQQQQQQKQTVSANPVARVVSLESSSEAQPNKKLKRLSKQLAIDLDNLRLARRRRRRPTNRVNTVEETTMTPIDHLTSIVLDPVTGLPTMRTSLYGSLDEIIYDFEFKAKKSTIPNSGNGMFCTFLGARTLKMWQQARGDLLIDDRCAREEMAFEKKLTAQHVEGYNVEVTLTGSDIFGETTHPYVLRPLVATWPKSDRGEIKIRFTDPYQAYLIPELDAIHETEASKKKIGFLGIHEESDYETSHETLFSSNFKSCGLINLGRYGPFRKQDRKNGDDFEFKAFIFSNEPNEWCFGVDEGISGCPQMVDITADDTGEPHEIAKKNIPMYVNEAGSSGDYVQNVFATDRDDRTVDYYLKIDEPMKAGDSIECLVDYGDVYEEVRERKGYGHANLKEGIKGDDHFETRVKRNHRSRDEVIASIQHLTGGELFRLVEWIDSHMRAPLVKKIEPFIGCLNIGVPVPVEEAPTAQQIIALRRIQWLGPLFEKRFLAILQTDDDDRVGLFRDHAELRDQCQQWISGMRWEMHSMALGLFMKDNAGLRDRLGKSYSDALKEESFEELNYKMDADLDSIPS